MFKINMHRAFLEPKNMCFCLYERLDLRDYESQRQ